MKIFISILITLIIGGGTGYVLGKGMNDSGSEAKKLQDSITMMKTQSLSIQKMGEMMQSSGLVMQAIGMKYKDDEAISKGKDLEAVGEKYIKENTKAVEEDTSMKKSME